jgi:hypothetical protein
MVKAPGVSLWGVLSSAPPGPPGADVADELLSRNAFTAVAKPGSESVEVRQVVSKVEVGTFPSTRLTPSNQLFDGVVAVDMA